jgi:hypothetical protein
MSKNYIEIVHEFVSESKDHRDESKTYHEKETLVFYAVRPTSEQYKGWTDDEEEPEFKDYLNGAAWRLNGGEAVYIYDKETIDGYRKLLDAIEAELGVE